MGTPATFKNGARNTLQQACRLLLSATTHATLCLAMAFRRAQAFIVSSLLRANRKKGGITISAVLELQPEHTDCGLRGPSSQFVTAASVSFAADFEGRLQFTAAAAHLTLSLQLKAGNSLHAVITTAEDTAPPTAAPAREEQSSSGRCKDSLRHDWWAFLLHGWSAGGLTFTLGHCYAHLLLAPAVSASLVQLSVVAWYAGSLLSPHHLWDMFAIACERNEWVVVRLWWQCVRCRHDGAFQFWVPLLIPLDGVCIPPSLQLQPRLRGCALH